MELPPPVLDDPTDADSALLNIVLRWTAELPPRLARPVELNAEVVFLDTALPDCLVDDI